MVPQPHVARSMVREAPVNARPDFVAVAELLTSELVSNAILAQNGVPTLSIEVLDDQVRIEVRPPEQSADLAERSLEGRALAIVDALATSWGYEGEIAWFELKTQGLMLPSQSIVD